MAKSSSEYWESRVAANTWKTYNSLEEKNRELLDFYTDASKAVKDELYTLAERHSKDGVLTLSEMHKQNRLTELNKKYEQIALELGKQTEEFAKGSMKGGFKEVYRNTAIGMGDEDFAMPNKTLMEKLLNEPWRGDSFSGRLWKNQKKLATGLNDILLNGLQQGKTTTEMAVNLHNFMGEGFNICHRLVRTESMHYLNNATMQRYKDAGIKYVQIWCALDERTCSTCGQYHGKIYPIDKCPVLPFHANCRCTIIPVTDEKLIAKLEDIYVLKDTTDKWAKEAKKELLLDEQSLSKRCKESAVVYDSKGKYLFTKRGDEKSVVFTKSEAKLFAGGTITHNHPSGASFSIADIKTLKKSKVAELRAIGEDGVYYIRPPKEWPKEIQGESELSAELKAIRTEVRKHYQKLYEDGKINKNERLVLSSDEYIRVFAEKFGFQYGKDAFNE